MSETVKQQAGARIINAAAQLAMGKMLGPLFTICETQHQVGTQKLERYLEVVGDRLKTCAFEIRMGYDTLATRLAESERRVAELEAKYDRDVYGLNNEGDPIGGEPAGGYANDNKRLRERVAELEAQQANP